jgi:[ribosomal protein S5]-alanine N-acetyltransferase
MDLSQLTIETERLRLVPASTHYAEQIFLEFREPITAYLNHAPPESVDIVKKRIQDRETQIKSGSQLFMVVLRKDSSEFFGCFALEDLHQTNPELGGWLKQSAHGNRYGQEAAAALQQWADKNLQHDHVVWPCAAMNTPSRKLAESLGGKVCREYEKKTASGNVFPYVEYWLPKDNEKQS